MLRSLVVAALLGSAAGAHAQADLGWNAFQRALADGAGAVRAGAAQAGAEDRLLRETLETMAAVPRAGGAVAPRVAAFLRAPGTHLYVSDSKVPFGYGLIRSEDGRTWRMLSLGRGLFAAPDASLAHPWVAAQLSDGASRLIDLDFPESAEKEHMRLSRKLRTWIEMAGPAAAPWARLDVLERADPALAGHLRAWVDRCGPFASKPCDMAAFGKKVGKPTLASLTDANAALEDQLRARLERERSSGRDGRGYELSLRLAAERAKALGQAARLFEAFREEELDWAAGRQ